MMFVLYEIMGVVTNLGGGTLAAKLGLKVTLILALLLQILGMLALCFVDIIFDLQKVGSSGSGKIQATLYIALCQVRLLLLHGLDFTTLLLLPPSEGAVWHCKRFNEN